MITQATTTTRIFIQLYFNFMFKFILFYYILFLSSLLPGHSFHTQALVAIIFPQGYRGWGKIVCMRKIAEINCLPQRCICRDYPCYARFREFEKVVCAVTRGKTFASAQLMIGKNFLPPRNQDTPGKHDGPYLITTLKDWICHPLKRYLTKIPTWVPGGHFHINLYGTCRFSGYHFSA